MVQIVWNETMHTPLIGKCNLTWQQSERPVEVQGSKPHMPSLKKIFKLKGIFQH